MNRENKKAVPPQAAQSSHVAKIDKILESALQSYIENGPAPKGFFRSLKDAFTTAARPNPHSFRKNPDYRTLESLKPILKNDLKTKDNANMLITILPLKEEALRAFYKRAADEDIVAMTLMAKIAGFDALYERFSAALVQVDTNIERMAIDALEELDKGYKNRFDKIADKAFHSIIATFEPEDYAKLSHYLQSAVAAHFSKNIARNGLDSYRVAHSKIIQALKIPDSLQNIHKDTMEYLQRRIITDDELGTAYSLFSSPKFAAMDQDQKVELADFHMHNLASLYGTLRPKIKLEERDDGSSMAMGLDGVSFFHDVAGLHPVLYINSKEEGAGIHHTDGERYLNSVSHEFAHILEKSLQMGITDLHEGTMSAHDKRNFPEIPEDSKLHSLARIFNINATSDGIRAYDTYISSSDNKELYFKQLNERHAYWYGAYATAKIAQAVEARTFVAVPEIYKLHVMQSLATTAAYLMTLGSEFYPLAETMARAGQKIGETEGQKLQDYFMPAEVKAIALQAEKMLEDGNHSAEITEVLESAKFIADNILHNMKFLEKVVNDWLPAGPDFEREDTRFREQLLGQHKPK